MQEERRLTLPEEQERKLDATNRKTNAPLELDARLTHSSPFAFELPRNTQEGILERVVYKASDWTLDRIKAVKKDLAAVTRRNSQK